MVRKTIKGADALKAQVEKRANLAEFNFQWSVQDFRHLRLCLFRVPALDETRDLFIRRLAYPALVVAHQAAQRPFKKYLAFTPREDVKEIQTALDHLTKARKHLSGMGPYGQSRAVSAYGAIQDVRSILRAAVQEIEARYPANFDGKAAWEREIRRRFVLLASMVYFDTFGEMPKGTEKRKNIRASDFSNLLDFVVPVFGIGPVGWSADVKWAKARIEERNLTDENYHGYAFGMVPLDRQKEVFGP